ncbi:hypothetical protein [Cellulomonas pakistanensis]|uniref:NERD domain-containing protein n=1 Tax=Cellulomonas pakistanensis TaxID=992287 RepID=A0A919PAW7_9CELL|nr:hypothetical protein [Cellulomonas pakistanensis]GIG37635.1 hypothetical protein Cpa01nite_30160 [Cellulomonas pakistanensis]
MDQGIGTERTERRMRRRGLRRAANGRATGVPSARPEVDRSDDWFDAWLTEAAEVAGARGALADAGAAGWTVLHDLHRPGASDASLEHVAVGPGGVVVIGSVRWTGAIAVADGTLRHQGYGRTTDVTAVADAAGAVTALLAPAHRRAVQAVVWLSGRELAPTAVRGGATAVGERELAAHLVALPPVFSAEDVALVVEYLTGELAGPAGPDQLTVDDVFRPAAVWRTGADAATRTADTRATDAVATPPRADAVPRYAQPANRAVAGLHAGQAEAHADGPGTAAPRGARGDAALRVGLVVLGLLTVGNVLLAWLDAAH